MHTVRYNFSRSIARSSHLPVINLQPNLIYYFRIFHYFLAINDKKKQKINQSSLSCVFHNTLTRRIITTHMDGKSFTFARNNGTKVAVIDTIESNLVGLNRNQPGYSKLYLSRFEKKKLVEFLATNRTFPCYITLSYYILHYTLY